MASITERKTKSGLISFRFKASRGKGLPPASDTWQQPPNMSLSAARKEAQRRKVLFEESVRRGEVSMDGKTKFGDYCRRWLDNATIAPATRDGYNEVMKRIDVALGHLPVEKLQGHHLEAFYKELRETCTKGGGRATPTRFTTAYDELGLSQAKFAALAGVARTTLKKVLEGASVSSETACKLCKPLGKPVDELFKIEITTLSDETIMHYHRFIRTVLGDAKRKRVILYNVASEHIIPPKTPRHEARYYDDVQACLFREALEKESDIRKRASLTLTLFTGVRRGELCGLSWADIDFDNCAVSINKASQYQCGTGIVEVPTKNASSVRTISIPSYVVDLLREYRTWWVEHRFKWGQGWQGELERLFIQDNGQPINPNTLNKWLKDVLKRNNLPYITMHSLRHTFATLAISSGTDIRTVQSLTGHAQASTLVDIYAHVNPSSQKKATSAIADILLSDAATG